MSHLTKRLSWGGEVVVVVGVGKDVGWVEGGGGGGRFYLENLGIDVGLHYVFQRSF